MKKILILLLLYGISGTSYGQTEIEEGVVPPPPKLIVKFNIAQLLEPKSTNYELSLEHFLNNQISLEYSAAYIRDNSLDDQESNLSCRCQGYRIGTGVHWFFKGVDRIDSGYLGLMLRYEQYFGRKKVLIDHGDGTFFQHDEFAFRQSIAGAHLKYGWLSYFSENWAIDAGIALGTRYFNNKYEEENLAINTTYELVDDNKVELFYTDDPGQHYKLSLLLFFKIAYTIK